MKIEDWTDQITIVEKGTMDKILNSYSASIDLKNDKNHVFLPRLLKHNGNPACGATGIGILAFRHTERHSCVS